MSHAATSDRMDLSSEDVATGLACVAALGPGWQARTIRIGTGAVWLEVTDKTPRADMVEVGPGWPPAGEVAFYVTRWLDLGFSLADPHTLEQICFSSHARRFGGDFGRRADILTSMEEAVRAGVDVRGAFVRYRAGALRDYWQIGAEGLLVEVD